MSNPKVYVGTYGKYNRGSIAGGWVSLKECKDYQAFLRKCRALHRGERDPEYMIQDSEDFPDGLDCMEWLSEQEFNDVMAACREEEEEQKAGLSPAERLRLAMLSMMNGAKPAAKAVSADGQYKAWLEEFCAAKDDPDYYRKSSVGALKIQGKFWLIEKPKIDNRFCFHDEGPNYQFYLHLMADKEHRLAEYFKQENLARFDNIISKIEKGEDYSGDNRVWLEHCYKDGRVCVTTSTHWSGSNLTLCTDEERAQILAAAKFGRTMMEHRLDAYLKRYGVSKIHTWTYWADA